MDGNCEHIVYLNSKNQIVRTLLEDEIAEEKIIDDTANFVVIMYLSWNRRYIIYQN